MRAVRGSYNLLAQIVLSEDAMAKTIGKSEPRHTQALKRSSERLEPPKLKLSLTGLLKVQHNLLEQIQICAEILTVYPTSQAVLDWRDKLEFLLTGTSHSEFGTLIEGYLLDTSLRGTIDFDLPTDADQQLLVGVIFAEASSTPDDDDEKRGIAACICNMAYYANYTEQAKKCYNSSFGDGSILSAIRSGSKAYGSPQWKKVMAGDSLQTRTSLEKALIPSEINKLRACVQSVSRVVGLATPIVDPKSGRNLLQFNQATDSPPNPKREEKIVRYGSHTFYSFIAGRECQ